MHPKPNLKYNLNFVTYKHTLIMLLSISSLLYPALLSSVLSFDSLEFKMSLKPS